MLDFRAQLLTLKQVTCSRGRRSCFMLEFGGRYGIVSWLFVCSLLSDGINWGQATALCPISLQKWQMKLDFFDWEFCASIGKSNLGLQMAENILKWKSWVLYWTEYSLTWHCSQQRPLRSMPHHWLWPTVIIRFWLNMLQ